jgi:hypothetical protein
MRSNNKRLPGSVDNVLLQSSLCQPVLCSECNHSFLLDNIICKIVLLELYSNIFLDTLDSRSFISAVVSATVERMLLNIRILERCVANELS